MTSYPPYRVRMSLSPKKPTPSRLPDAPFPPTPGIRVLSPLQAEMAVLSLDATSQYSVDSRVEAANHPLPTRSQYDVPQSVRTDDRLAHNPVSYGRPVPRGNSSNPGTRPPTHRSATLPTPSSSSTINPRAYAIYAPPVSGDAANSTVPRTRPPTHRSSTYPDIPREWTPPSAPASNASQEDLHHVPSIYQSATSNRVAWVYDRTPLPHRSYTLPASSHSRSMTDVSSAAPPYHPPQASSLRHESYSRPAATASRGSSESTYSSTSTALRPAHSPLRDYTSQHSLTSSPGSVTSDTTLYSQPYPSDEEWEEDTDAHTAGPLSAIDRSNEPGYEEVNGPVDIYLAVEMRRTALRPATDFVWLITWRVGHGAGQRILRLHWQGLTTGDLGHYFGAYTQNADEPIVGVDSAVCLHHMQMFLLGRLDRVQREELERIPAAFDAKRGRKALCGNIGWVDEVLAAAVAKGLFDEYSVHKAMVQGRGLMN